MSQFPTIFSANENTF